MSARFSYNTFNQSALWGLPPALPEQFAAAASAGYDAVGVDLPTVHAHLASGVDLHRLGADLRAAGLSCHELVWLTISDDAERTERGVERALPVIAALEPDQVVVTATGMTEAVIDQLDLCAGRLADVGAGASLEFLAGQPVASLAAAVTLVSSVAHEVKVVVDAWHLHHSGEALTELAVVPRERIGLVQVCDAREPASDDLVHEMMHRRAMPGDGIIDLPGFCSAVEATGYDGVVSVEVLAEEWRTADPHTFATRTLETSRAAWASRGAQRSEP